MARRSFRPEWLDQALERRDLLSGVALRAAPAIVAQGGAHHGNLFHRNGIDGLVLHRAFVNQLNDRLSNSAAQSARVRQAFQVFISDYQQLPVTPPPGSSGPTVSDLLAKLTSEVNLGLSRLDKPLVRPTPSQRTSLKKSPLAPLALVPYADAQINAMAAELAATPPVVGPDGQRHFADPTAAVNTAVNAILNALAETSIHPNLFLSPSDFYISPNVTFTVDSGDAPASSSPGFFVRGPHGIVLPGATLHPHVPL
jgi:hypothetical protein